MKYLPESVAADDKLSDMNERREDFVARMEAEGFEIFYPRENELQVDLDTEQAMLAFTPLYAAFCREFASSFEPKLLVTHSRSGPPGKHIRIFLDKRSKFSARDRITWQACLGSDPMRELLSLARQFRGDATPTLFVETKETAAEIKGFILNLSEGY